MEGSVITWTLSPEAMEYSKMIEKMAWKTPGLETQNCYFLMCNFWKIPLPSGFMKIIARVFDMVIPLVLLDFDSSIWLS